jgi:hypothetical protein
MADRYLLESGAPDGYLLEDSSGVLLLEGVDPERWQPIFPERIPAKPGLSVAILAGAFFFFNTAVLPAAPQMAPGGTAQIFAGKQVQYQAQTGPFAAALTVTPNLDSWGQPPSQPVYRTRAQAPSVFEPPTSVRPLRHVEWLPSYPDQIYRQVVRATSVPLSFPRISRSRICAGRRPIPISTWRLADCASIRLSRLA